MRALITSDLHLTDRPLDEYRWKVFEQIRDLANDHGVSDLFILGDLTEFKDQHSSRLVNKLIDGLYRLRKTSRINEIYILKGNHDGVDPSTPYFKFLGCFPWCRFYIEPTWLDLGKATVLLLPHTKTPAQDWKGLDDIGRASHIFLHATFKGAVAETGAELEGAAPLDLFKGLRACIISGDVHVPQTVGKVVEYVGAPYPIRFGDSFPPQMLLLEGKKKTYLPLRNIQKLTLSGTASGLEKGALGRIVPGDQVKVRLVLENSELGAFHELKLDILRKVQKAGGTLCQVVLEKGEEKRPLAHTPKRGGEAVPPAVTLKHYCRLHKVEEGLAAIGQDLVKEGTSNEAV